MSSLADATVASNESPTTLALRLCGYLDDEKVQMHVKRLTGADLSLRRIAIIRQSIPPGRVDSAREGHEPSDLPLRRLVAARSNRDFTKALLRAAGQ